MLECYILTMFLGVHMYTEFTGVHVDDYELHINCLHQHVA